MFDINHNNSVIGTAAPFEFFKHNGYYSVGNKIFNRRMLALQEASKTNTDLKWHFHDDVYSKINWQKRPDINISELYRMRAKQLREKYDYLIVSWSGGADSTTIVDSFLKNNIPLDEIVISWATSKADNYHTPNASLDASNMLSEWDYSIQPQIDYYRTNYPNLKITVVDYINELNVTEDLEDTFDIIEKHSYISIKKFRAVDSILHKRLEKYKNVACLVGIAPVEPILLDQTYFGIYFFDNLMNSVPKSDYRLDGSPRIIEYFYSSPDCPEIVQEQAHLMYNYFNDHPSQRSLLSNLNMQKDRTFLSSHALTSFDIETVRHIRKGLIYPDWDLNIFQVAKPKMQTGLNEWYTWFYSNPHSKEFTDPWRTAVRSQESLINPKYFVVKDNQVINYKNCSTKVFVIGKFKPLEST